MTKIYDRTGNFLSGDKSSSIIDILNHSDFYLLNFGHPKFNEYLDDDVINDFKTIQRQALIPHPVKTLLYKLQESEFDDKVMEKIQNDPNISTILKDELREEYNKSLNAYRDKLRS